MTIYATSRAGNNVNITATPPNKIVCAALDISQSSSIRSFADKVKKEHGTVDVLINNAGVNLEQTKENAKKIIDTNYRGTQAMCLAFIPLMEKGGRIVNVSSTASGLEKYSKEIQARFRDENMTLDDLDDMASEFEEAVMKGTVEQQGWFNGFGAAYGVSKSCQNALTAVLAREHPDLLINACCPGWVASDMGKMLGSPSKSLGMLSSFPVIDFACGTNKLA